MAGGVLLAALATGCVARHTGGGLTPAPAPAASTQGRRYVIQSGDTLLTIATRFQVSYTAILAANPELESGVLTPGQTILIPGEAPAPAPTPAPSPMPLPRAALPPTPGHPGPIAAEATYTWPLQGEIIARFRQAVPWRARMPNQGIDIRPASSDIVVAARSGRVNTFRTVSGFGQCVLLEHTDGAMSFYGHLNEIAVTHGTWVRQGEVLGVAGSTGDSSGVQLHFRIMRGERFVDPLPLLK